jgi:hypothetical protein
MREEVKKQVKDLLREERVAGTLAIKSERFLNPSIQVTRIINLIIQTKVPKRVLL